MKKSKVLIIFIFFVLILILLQSSISAFNVGDLSGNTTQTSEIQSTGNKVIQIISTIGSVISVIVIIVLGIKYMIGSVEEKASYKKTMIPYLIGSIFVFTASTIASVIYGVAINI